MNMHLQDILPNLSRVTTLLNFNMNTTKNIKFIRTYKFRFSYGIIL